MSKYVDIEYRAEFVKALCNLFEGCHFKHCTSCVCNTCSECVDRSFSFLSHLLPAADVQEVKHGRWICKRDFDGGKIFQCSNCCMHIASFERVNADYCKYCGAKMNETEKPE